MKLSLNNYDPWFAGEIRLEEITPVRSPDTPEAKLFNHSCITFQCQGQTETQIKFGL